MRSLLTVTHELFRAEEARTLVGRTARLIGLQFHEPTMRALGLEGDAPAVFALLLAALAKAQGEQVEVDGARVVQAGWKLMRGVDLAPDLALAAWNPLWEGALAAHNRDLRLETSGNGETITWMIQ